ncbi:RNA polymerase sigma-70 factor [Dyadobacter subterraneus]|uniref:RNA polymerase sigma-70 factor n=1 Tax=Dyadobacter subterraneus TaxID=2773304 RepID=A0ABR9WM67_9BACT|nr:RNA polymerase sigma-70 factor [Dyadobacter subterraneus]MBE9466604.1 RNA polymerase sigma-70 factor [Dyadobacter subterraneus]
MTACGDPSFLPIVISYPINAEAFETIYNKYWKDLYSLCFYYIKDQEQSKEIVQDIFKSIWERRNELDVDGPIENYLFRSVKLKVAQYYRTNNIHQKHLEAITRDLKKSENSTENIVLFNALKDQISDLVERLPEQCQRVFLLSRENGFSTQEISSQLSISPKTAENHLTKALNFLRKHIILK